MAASVPQKLHKQIRGSVYDFRLSMKVGGAVYKPQEFDDPLNPLQVADLRFDGAQEV